MWERSRVGVGQDVGSPAEGFVPDVPYVVAFTCVVLNRFVWG